jgi:FAD/FMN-containing dehydrogenase
MLMEVRRLCLPALERRGATLLEDVGVPRGRVPDLLARIEEIARDTGLEIATFGHAGDGNMHPTIVFDRASSKERARALKAAGALFEAALDLGGTITGEHGVGTLKLPWLEREIGGLGRRLTAGIKGVFDPQGILNPGKAL